VQAERLQLARERAAEAALHPAVTAGDLSTWPTRGSRARDAQLLESVRARVGGRPTVLFAGDVVGVDVAVAATRAGDATCCTSWPARRGRPSAAGARAVANWSTGLRPCRRCPPPSATSRAACTSSRSP
jgi:hypothetical protein